MSYLGNLSYFASGNVNVSTFVSLVSGSPYFVTTSIGTNPIIGVSQMGPQNAPGTAAGTPPYAGTQGKQMQVYGNGELALVVAGGTISAGDYLVANSLGQALTQSLSATGQAFVGGQALENAVSGVSIPISVKTYTAGNV